MQRASLPFIAIALLLVIWLRTPRKLILTDLISWMPPYADNLSGREKKGSFTSHCLGRGRGQRFKADLKRASRLRGPHGPGWVSSHKAGTAVSSIHSEMI